MAVIEQRSSARRMRPGRRAQPSRTTNALTVTIALDARSGLHHLMLQGELDVATSSDLALVLSSLLGDHTKGAVLDLAGVEFLDLAGARLLGAASVVFGERDREITLLGARPPVARVLRLIGVSPAADRPSAEPFDTRYPCDRMR